MDMAESTGAKGTIAIWFPIQSRYGAVIELWAAKPMASWDEDAITDCFDGV
jgi:hypothetical protein